MKAPLQTSVQEEQTRQSEVAQRAQATQTLRDVGFVDNRPTAVAQRKLQEMISNSPRVLQQKVQMDAIQNSPRMVAQRQQREALFGGAMQRQEDEASPDKRQPAQAMEEPLQAKFASEAPVQLAQAPATKFNNTSLPDQLKSGIESMSGMSMDHVKVHYNSSQPAQLNAHAYAQGSDIHLAPGQEKHLPHEAWHVVQQAQGRVRPTTQMGVGVLMNDDEGLETEADVMGGKAMQLNSMQIKESTSSAGMSTTKQLVEKRQRSSHVIQAGGQLGKGYRLAKEGVSRLKPVPSGGMWLAETDAAGGFHQQVRIGATYHEATAVSFGHDGRTPVAKIGIPSRPLAEKDGGGDGIVYRDKSKPKKQIMHCPMTNEQREAAEVLLLGEIGKKAPYALLTNNCVHWSMRVFDKLKAEVKK
ncbi:DUF4157 domain-containing protein [Janthinobacterium fluminis]|uniref:DUF4157 domain-containing protein n=1 Tax=Janthinobacterium fluminis TaxID=2987524 RepID=A0ABT5K4T2_9BURK|nr:DUF4157 domain-containing protein [Janthinobacterium fluminis]MDC8759993.1 DUF4157 domain-containing protein [Janthinobacterium fluminis]